MQSIKSQPLSLRPREKLAKHGVSALTTTELMMLILGSGSKEFPVQIVARQIVKKLEKDNEISMDSLCGIAGVGTAKASQILAAMELSDRLRPTFQNDKLDTVENVLMHVHEIRFLEKEQVIGLYLDARMKLIHKETLSVGGLNQAALAARDVFAPIKQHPILFIILAHNHPSEDPTPSRDDLLFTQRIVDGGKLLGVELLDHIIVTKNSHYSFKKEGQIVGST